MNEDGSSSPVLPGCSKLFSSIAADVDMRFLDVSRKLQWQLLTYLPSPLCLPSSCWKEWKSQPDEETQMASLWLNKICWINSRWIQFLHYILEAQLIMWPITSTLWESHFTPGSCSSISRMAELISEECECCWWEPALCAKYAHFPKLMNEVPVQWNASFNRQINPSFFLCCSLITTIPTSHTSFFISRHREEMSICGFHIYIKWRIVRWRLRCREVGSGA